MNFAIVKQAAEDDTSDFSETSGFSFFHSSISYQILEEINKAYLSFFSETTDNNWETTNSYAEMNAPSHGGQYHTLTNLLSLHTHKFTEFFRILTLDIHCFYYLGEIF